MDATAATAAQPIGLGPELTIVHAATHRETLLNRLAELDATGAETLVLDLHDAAEVDSSAVQLLLALRRSLHAQGRQLQVLNASRTLRDVLKLYGLVALLDDSTPAAALLP